MEKFFCTDQLIHETFDIKMQSYQFRNSHYKDKMVSQLSYPYNGQENGLYIETCPWLLIPKHHDNDYQNKAGYRFNVKTIFQDIGIIIKKWQ